MPYLYRSFSAKEPLEINQHIRHPMGLQHPVPLNNSSIIKALPWMTWNSSSLYLSWTLQYEYENVYWYNCTYKYVCLFMYIKTYIMSIGVGAHDLYKSLFRTYTCVRHIHVAEWVCLWKTCAYTCVYVWRNLYTKAYVWMSVYADQYDLRVSWPPGYMINERIHMYLWIYTCVYVQINVYGVYETNLHTCVMAPWVYVW